MCAVRPAQVQGLTVKTSAENSAVSNVMFIPPAQRSMTYNIVITCDAGNFQLVSPSQMTCFVSSWMLNLTSIKLSESYSISV